MLNESSEAKIKQWVTVTLDNIKLFIKAHNDKRQANFDCLNSAIRENENLSCYWNVYHSTCTHENFDDALWAEIQTVRAELKSLLPEF